MEEVDLNEIPRQRRPYQKGRQFVRQPYDMVIGGS